MKRLSKNIFEFDVSVYPRKVWVSIGAPYDVIKDMFEGVDQMDENAYAQVDHTGIVNPQYSGGVLIRFADKDSITFNTVCHESAHAAMEIFSYIGAYADNRNQEPFAYLVGWIGKCINDAISQYEP